MSEAKRQANRNVVRMALRSEPRAKAKEPLGSRSHPSAPSREAANQSYVVELLGAGLDLNQRPLGYESRSRCTFSELFGQG